MTAYARDWLTLIAALLAGVIIIGLGAAADLGGWFVS